MKTSGYYINTKKMCPKCEVLSYIRVGGDFKHKDEYLKFFDKAYFDTELIKRLFIEDKAKTKINGNILSIKMKGMNWKLRLLHEGKRGIEVLYRDSPAEAGAAIKENTFRSVAKRITAEKAMQIMENIAFDNGVIGIENYEDKNHSKKDLLKKVWETIAYKLGVLLGL